MIHNIIGRCCDYVGDPRIGSALLLAALISFGAIYLMRSQKPAHQSQSDSQGQSSTEVIDYLIMISSFWWFSNFSNMMCIRCPEPSLLYVQS